MAGPCRGDCEADGIMLLGFMIGCGSTAWVSRHGTGSTAWVQRHAANPSVGVRRQLPLHKGGPVAGRPYCFCRIAPNRPWFYCPVRQRSMGVATRWHSAWLEKRRKFWYTEENPQNMGKGRIFL